MGAALPYPSPSSTSGRAAALSLLHLCFTYRVAGDSHLPPIWEKVACAKGCTDGLATLNHNFLRGLPSCRRVFGGRAHLSAYLPPLAFVKSVSLLNPYLDSACTGGVIPRMTHQGMVKESTHEGADVSLLAQQLDGRLVSERSLWTAPQVRLACIPSTDKALRDLGTFAFVAFHLFSAVGRHASAVAELTRLIKRLEELHTEVQGMITTPHLPKTFLYDVLRLWSLYLNRCVTALSSEDVGAAGSTATF